jgi:hypothetical protein
MMTNVQTDSPFSFLSVSRMATFSRHASLATFIVSALLVSGCGGGDEHPESAASEDSTGVMATTTKANMASPAGDSRKQSLSTKELDIYSVGTGQTKRMDTKELDVY